jgi:hypothetical protein
MQFIQATIATLAGLMLIAGNGAQSQQQGTVQAPPAKARPAGGDQTLDISGAFSSVRAIKQIVVRDADAFAALWKQHQPNADVPPPQVDFKKCDVVAVFAGPKNTGGYSIAVESIDRKGKTAVIKVKLLKPNPRTMTIQAFTYPFAMKATAKLPASVRFQITEEERKP